MANKKFTDEEKQLITLYDTINWVTRDKDGEIYGFNKKPHKEFKYGSWFAADSDEPDGIYIAVGFESYNYLTHKYDVSKSFTNISFRDIQWEDDEPTSREEILMEDK